MRIYILKLKLGMKYKNFINALDKNVMVILNQGNFRSYWHFRNFNEDMPKIGISSPGLLNSNHGIETRNWHHPKLCI